MTDGGSSSSPPPLFSPTGPSTIRLSRVLAHLSLLADGEKQENTAAQGGGVAGVGVVDYAFRCIQSNMVALIKVVTARLFSLEACMFLKNLRACKIKYNISTGKTLNRVVHALVWVLRWWMLYLNRFMYLD